MALSALVGGGMTAIILGQKYPLLGIAVSAAFLFGASWLERWYMEQACYSVVSWPCPAQAVREKMNMAAIHKTDLNAYKSPRARRALKEEATFDNELQRYVMPSERVLMPKLEQSEVWKNKSQGRRLIKHE